jgi:ankyrin repeat protein
VSADELTNAVVRRDVATVQSLLQKGVDVNAKDKSGNTALIQASFNGYMEEMRVLISGGADVNARGKKNATALMAACSSRRLEVVEMLLQAGADMRAKTDDGKTALEFAHQVKSDSVVEAILRAEGRERPYTPQLDMTGNVKFGWLDSLPSETSLHEAVRKGDKELVTSLLAGNGVDVNAEYMGNPPLYTAVEKRYTEVAEMLLAHGADVNAKGLFGSETPLQNAATRGGGFPRKVDKELVNMLLAHGADVNVCCGVYAVTVLHEVARDGDVEIAEVLLANKANVNANGDKGLTPLHWATMKGHRDMVELLLAHGANINAKDEDGRSPSDWATKNGHKEVAEVLQQHGGHS